MSRSAAKKQKNNEYDSGYEDEDSLKPSSTTESDRKQQIEREDLQVATSFHIETNDKLPIISETSRPHRSQRSIPNYREIDDDDDSPFTSIEEINGRRSNSNGNRKRKRSDNRRRGSAPEDDEEEYHEEEEVDDDEEDEIEDRGLTRRSSRSSFGGAKMIEYVEDDGSIAPRRSTRARKKKNYGDDFAYDDADLREASVRVNGMTSTRSSRTSRNSTTLATSSVVSYATRSHAQQREQTELLCDFEKDAFAHPTRPTRRTKNKAPIYYEEEEEIEEEVIHSEERAKKKVRVTRKTNQNSAERIEEVVTEATISEVVPSTNTLAEQTLDRQIEESTFNTASDNMDKGDDQQKQRPQENEINGEDKRPDDEQNMIEEVTGEEQSNKDSEIENQATAIRDRQRRHSRRARIEEEDEEYVQSAHEEEEEEEDDEAIDDDDEDECRPRTRRQKGRSAPRRSTPEASNRYNLRGRRNVSDSEDEFRSSSMSEGESQPIKRRLRPRTDIQLQPYTAPPREQPAAPSFERSDRRAAVQRAQLQQQLQNMAFNGIRSPPNRPLSDSSSSSSSSDSDSDAGISVIRPAGNRGPSASSRYAHIAPINSHALDGGRSKKKKKNANADIDPIAHDHKISWDSIGGLAHHVEALKEMILLPLLYPSYFDKYQIAPPRGVIFYGPPGTGKTLVARALAGACTSNGQPIAFFMRKGADILSKWVGEAEKQLRLLFERAKELQPSIIFFDEIDGLAPVRSSKQDYIHSSIVSTLLALMDGLDNRGQVVVIGATNRIDAIDPALRRPGRFDRELAFTLPNMDARKEILRIHTKDWKPQPEPELVESMCRLCVGYCGADIKALVTEAAMHALKRKFPQIYRSTARLNIDLDSVQVTRMDFLYAMKQITPAAHRHALVHSQPLPSHLAPVLRGHLENLKKIVRQLFPASSHHLDPDSNDAHSNTHHFGDLSDDHNVNVLSTMSDYYLNPPSYRPWVIVRGSRGMGQQYLGQGLLYALEAFPVYSLSLASLFSNVNSRGIEESLVSTLAEARKHAPSIVYIPEIDEWWRKGSELMRSTLITMLCNLRSSLPVLVLATSNSDLDDEEDDMPSQIMELFRDHVYQATAPTTEQIRAMFEVVKNDIKRPPLKRVIQKEPTAIIASTATSSDIVTESTSAVTTDIEHERQERAKRREQFERAEKIARKHEKQTLMELRLHLRDIMIKVTNQNIYQLFTARRYDAPNDDLIYLCDMAKKLENGYYTSLKLFLEDIKSIRDNAELYLHGGSGTGATPVTNAIGDGEGTTNILAANMTVKEAEKRLNAVMRGRQLYDAVHSVASQLINIDLVERCKAITRRRNKYEAKKLAREEEDKKFLQEHEQAVPNGQPVQNEQNKQTDQESSNSTEHLQIEEQMQQHPNGDALHDKEMCEATNQQQNNNNEQKSIQGTDQGELENDIIVDVIDGAVAEEELIDMNQEVEIDDDRLDEWFEKLIHASKELSIDELDKWFSTIYQHIFQYRFSAQRNDLLKELESMLDSLHSVKM